MSLFTQRRDRKVELQFKLAELREARATTQDVIADTRPPARRSLNMAAHKPVVRR